MTGDLDEFTAAVLRGEPIRRMKSSEGQQLRDSYLVKRLGADAKQAWLEPVYEKTSGYVHLSDAHLFRAVRTAAESTFNMSITRREAEAPEGMWLELVEAFEAATRLVLRVVAVWIEQKEAHSHEMSQGDA